MEPLQQRHYSTDRGRDMEKPVRWDSSVTISASYRNMLYLTLTGRQDYVSNMPRNNRSFFYPSISAGFILTELDALKNNIVNHAKLRVSYAEVGQAGDFLENYYSTPTYGGGILYVNSNHVPDERYYRLYSVLHDFRPETENRRIHVRMKWALT